jgi:acyl-CoA hydrolase
MADNENHSSTHSITMSEIMTPNMVNFHGNVHGGYILSLLDKVAYACASRYAAQPVVTLSVDQVVFKRPIYVGELVICHAMINYVGNTSMEVGIRVIAENLLTRESRHTNSCYFTMVAVDDKGKPIKIPPLSLTTELQKRRYAAALERKQSRLLAHAVNKSGEEKPGES